MMKSFLLMLVSILAVTSLIYGQNNTITIRLNDHKFGHLLTKALVERTDLGYYSSKIDTVIIKEKIFNYQSKIYEPEFFQLTFFWGNKKQTSFSFWANSNTYDLTIDKDFKISIKDSVKLNYNKDIYELETKIAYSLFRSDSLVRNIDYENKKIIDVENRIIYIRDSANLSIDEIILKKNLLTNLNSPLGLYSLIKYSERPYSNQRIKAHPKEIEKLLDGFGAEIKLLPSAKMLRKKIELSKKMLVGQQFKYIKILDTGNKLIDLKDYKSKYILLDFWASWCIPCRNENPNLVENYKRYKSQGFQILSISRDKFSERGNWLEAIKQDNIGLWPQLIDLNDLAKKTYNIRFLPSNLLISPAGIIIGKDLIGDKLNLMLHKIYSKEN